MSEKRMVPKRTFIEGEGYLVEEAGPVVAGSPVNAKPAATAGMTLAQVRAAAQAMGMIVIDQKNMKQEAEALGFIVVSREDLDAYHARISELENVLDHVAKGGDFDPDMLQPGGESIPVEGEETPAPRERLSVADMKADIAAANSLDALTALMKGEQRKSLLQAADLRAEELRTKEKKGA